MSDIILEGAPNARDLGGIRTSDGRRLKYGRLFRSGMLYGLTDRDVKYLRSVGLKTVIDLRTPQEQREKPDRVIEGVRYIDCPVLERKTEGITREKPETDDEEAVRTVAMAKKLMEREPDGRASMKSLYPILVSNPFPLAGYRRFMQLLLEHKNGALLFHCTLGKDRAGTAAALTLHLLGVPHEEITRDYMVTRERCAPQTQRLIANCRKYTDDEAILEYIRILDTVEEDFIAAAFETIDEKYGGMESFRRDRLSLTDGDIMRLRELYLD